MIGLVVAVVVVLIVLGVIVQGVLHVRCSQRDIEAADQWRTVPSDPGLPQMRDRRHAAQAKRARRAARNLRNAPRQRVGRSS